jgi:predicted RNA-binding Zn-ribbon protein involved in translation (DUF1610 family)
MKIIVSNKIDQKRKSANKSLGEYRKANERLFWAISVLIGQMSSILFDLSKTSTERIILKKDGSESDEHFDEAKNKLREELEPIFSKTQLLTWLGGDVFDYLRYALPAFYDGVPKCAIALLRRPLSDDLLLLCKFVNSPDECMSFCDGYGKRDLERHLSKEKITAMIDEAVSKMDFHEDPLLSKSMTGEFIYSLYFSKESWGLHEPWTKALHLVTEQKTCKTPPGDLNYLFMKQEDSLKICEWAMAKIIPGLILINNLLIEGIFQLFPKDTSKGNLRFIRLVQSACLLSSFKGPSKIYSLEKVYGLKEGDAFFACPYCGKESVYKKGEIKQMAQKSFALCSNCKKKVTIGFVDLYSDS